MGVPNSGVVLTEKDLNSIGFNFLAKPTFEFHDEDEESSKKEKEKEKEREQLQGEERCRVKVAAPMELKLSCLGEFKVEDDDDDGFKTPTSLDHRIPLILPCPPAPKKPKFVPSAKRRALAGPNRRVLLDLSNEIQTLFPADFGCKLKRVRHGGK